MHKSGIHVVCLEGSMCVCDGKELRVHIVAEELQKGASC